MPQEKYTVEFDCYNPECEEEVLFSLEKPAGLPGWGLCECGFGYVLYSNREDIRVFEENGDLWYKGNPRPTLHIECRVVDRMKIQNKVGGEVLTWGPRSEKLSETAISAAMMSEKVIFPQGFFEEHGIEEPGAFVIQLGVEAAPAVLRAIAQHYAQEVVKDIEKL